MGILLYDSIMVNGAINFGNYADVYSQDVNWRALSNTVQLSLLVMVASVIITFPLAWLVGRTDMPGKKTYRTLLVASYMILLMLVRLLGTAFKSQRRLFEFRFLSGILQLQQSPFDIYTMGGLAWVLTLFYSPFAFITISRAMEKMDPTLEEAARVSGASPLRTLVDVTLPLMAPSILAGGLLVFIAAVPASVFLPLLVCLVISRL